MFHNTRHIHLVAIGGIGMSGIAEILLNLGFTVSGSDLHASATTQRLQELGASIFIGHRRENVTKADVVVRSSAVTEANIEVTEARMLRIPVIRRAEMLAELMGLKHGIAVAGSHGKTTTTTFVAAALAAGNLDPTVIVGGFIKAMGSNAVLGGGDYVVAEADESDGSFLHLKPTIAVVTNIDYEHVDFYPDMDALRATFHKFLNQIPFYGVGVLCVDDAEVRAMIPHLDRKIVTYGISSDADVRADQGTIVSGEFGQEAVIWAFGQELGLLRLNMGGRHNLQNALAAIAVALELGVPFADIARGLDGCQGVGRRLESHGEHGGILVIDDYAHHPTEVMATMEVVLSYDRPVAVLFQPHRYSRTVQFSHEFADALSGAGVIGLLPVYAAGEEQPEGIGSDTIGDKITAKGVSLVTLLSGHDETFSWLKSNVASGSVLLTIGAGDVGRQVKPICDFLDAEKC